MVQWVAALDSVIEQTTYRHHITINHLLSFCLQHEQLLSTIQWFEYILEAGMYWMILDNGLHASFIFLYFLTNGYDASRSNNQLKKWEIYKREFTSFLVFTQPILCDFSLVVLSHLISIWPSFVSCLQHYNGINKLHMKLGKSHILVG